MRLSSPSSSTRRLRASSKSSLADMETCQRNLHEAAHGCAAVLLDVPFAYLTLGIDDEERHLDCPNMWQDTEEWRTWMQGGRAKDRAARNSRYLREVAVLLVASVVEADATGQSVEDVLSTSGALDMECAERIAQKIAGRERKFDFMAMGLRLAARLLDDVRMQRAIIRVATALSAHGRLERHEVRALMFRDSVDVAAVDLAAVNYPIILFGDGGVGQQVRRQLREVPSGSGSARRP
jgi:hypothetical protein